MPGRAPVPPRGGRMFRRVALAVLLLLGPAAAVRAEEPASGAAQNVASVLLGYSFGLANNPFGDAGAGDTGEQSVSSTEPLLGFSAVIGRDRPLHMDLSLAMANFGRLVSLVKGVEASPANGAADVRRAILADVTVAQRLTRSADASTAFFLSANTGFVFDAQADRGNNVEDASSYLMAGPTLRSRLGQKSSLTLDLFAGPSEVMTNREIFSSSWKIRDTRLRPRILFALDSSDDPNHREGNSFFDGTFLFGLWADLGLSQEFGDTYALFISRSIADFR